MKEQTKINIDCKEIGVKGALHQKCGASFVLRFIQKYGIITNSQKREKNKAVK